MEPERNRTKGLDCISKLSKNCAHKIYYILDNLKYSHKIDKTATLCYLSPDSYQLLYHFSSTFLGSSQILVFISFKTQKFSEQC